MGKRQALLERLKKESMLPQELFPGQPLIEIAGEDRVLVENHQGVCEYCTERITVKVKYGCIQIHGCRLELAQMSKEQLVIRGRIEGVSLCRRR